jgi:hypothetical protein
MISLNRKRTAATIKAKYRGADKRAKDVELLKAQKDRLNNLISTISFDSTFWKLSKTQLKKESFGKCAYCEANTEVVAHGDVEHYRPKSVYWWLAYTYDNYLYACQICNQIYKSDNFPISGVQLAAPQIRATSSLNELESLAGNISPDPVAINLHYTLQTFLQNHQLEQALLINPYFDNPTDYIAYEADDVIEEVRVVSKSIAKKPYIKAMEDYYGINRVELANFRFQTFRKFRIFKKAIRENIPTNLKNDILKEIEFMKSDRALFAGMIRYFDNVL